MNPTRLQLGVHRLETLPQHCLRVFLDSSWVHLGDAPDSPGLLKSWVRRVRRHRNGTSGVVALYEQTHFEPWSYQAGDRLPFADSSMTYVFSEHFFEHLFLDEAMALFRECRRVLVTHGVMRVCVPDADLRTSIPPEPIGFPKRRMPFTDPNKHKTRWSVYSLSEALRCTGFDPVPIRYFDRAGRFTNTSPTPPADCPDAEIVRNLSYLIRYDSLILDAAKPPGAVGSRA